MREEKLRELVFLLSLDFCLDMGRIPAVLVLLLTLSIVS